MFETFDEEKYVKMYDVSVLTMTLANCLNMSHQITAQKHMQYSD